MSAPRWAVGLLRRLARPGRADDLLGDLHEMHARRVARHGRWLAHPLTAWETLDLAAALTLLRWRGEDDVRLRGPAPGLDRDPHRTPRRLRMLRSIDAWRRDLVHAARALQRAPGFTAITVVTLALAIGSNAAIFSVVDTVLLDPLDYPAADRLVSIRASAPGSDLPEEFGPAPEFYVQYQEQSVLLDDLGMYRAGQTTVRADDHVDRLFVAQATPSLYTTLGAQPILGRLPTMEDPPGRVALISYRLWTTWFGQDSAVIGRSYEVSGDPRTVIGVMGPTFRYPDERIDVWVHQLISDVDRLRPGSFGFSLVGRMTEDASHDDLAAELAVLASRLPDRFGGPPQYARIIAQHRPVVRSLEEELVGDVAGPLWLLLGTVGIVLLIACANVANLFTVRAESRRRDLGVRQALGAGRGALIRTQMAEALLLAAVAGVAAAILAWVGLPLLVRAAPDSIPNLGATRLGGGALLFTATLSFAAACVFGWWPAFRFSRPDLAGALRQGGRGHDAGSHWGRNGLVLLQTALALVLLVGSGLLIRSFWALSHVDPGYDTEDIFTFQIAPDREELRDGPSFAQFHQGFMERVAGLPGVERVGLTNWLPLDEGAATNRFTTEHTALTGEEPPALRFTFIGGDYLETMGIALVQGRGFDPNDHRPGGATHALTSLAAADLLWPGEDPIGQRLSMSADTSAWITVIGVVENILVEDFRQEAPDPMIYLPMVGPGPRSWGVASPAYVVKSPRASLLAPDIRNLMREVVPESPMYRVFTMEGLAARSMAQLSFTMLMLAIASGLALILGAVGLYGVLSYVVSSRTSEIAVRMALGAEQRRVRRMVVLQGARVTVAGIGIGLVGALTLTRVLDSLLYGVGSLDSVTFLAMSAVMLGVALLASYLPARRASSVDPMQSLRAE